jgi:TonB family protein
MSEQSHDIEKYLRGELTPAEMHALEKRALDDPFLADALEGASQLSQHELHADLQSLHKALNERVDERKVISLWGWTARIAAGLILIAISTFVIINLTDDSNEQQLAVTKEEKSDTVQSFEIAGNATSSNQSDSAAASSENILLALDDQDADQGNDETKPTSGPAKKKVRRSEPIASEAKPTQQQEIAALRISAPKVDTLKSVTEIAQMAPVEAEKTAEGYFDDKVVVKDESKGKAKAIAVVPPGWSAEGFIKKLPDSSFENKAYTYSNASRAKDFLRDSITTTIAGVTKVTGRVTSAEDGSGLPGVNVVIKGTSTGTVTDINGNYQIEIPDPHATLVYSFIGLESMEMPVNNSPVVDAAMQQDVAQLSEVVVTGFGEVESSGPAYSTFQMAEPIGGRRAFKRYLEDKLIYPQQAIANKVEGKVTVQFIVETTGKLTNFNVVKGIGYGCDEELIRLIKQGPKWSATKRDDELVKSRVRVRIRFTLPKKK